MKILLNIISTPIGNLKDLTIRAIDTLKSVDFILCEDTRITRNLIQSFSIHIGKLITYNDYNASKVIPNVIESMNSDSRSTYALVSDAGSPLISDPGYKLVNECINNNIGYTVIPGACSVIAALTLSGFPTDKFMFVGFVNNKNFNEFKSVSVTLIFFESPKRLLNTLIDMKNIFENRNVAIVREITKIHEETVRGSFNYVISHFLKNEPRGEIVILLSPLIDNSTNTKEIKVLQKLIPLINNLSMKISIKELSNILSEYSGVRKNLIYKYIIDNKKKNIND